jgi:hypothetical protein
MTSTADDAALLSIIELITERGGQLTRDDLDTMTPAQRNAARRNGNLDNLLNGKQDNA